MDGISQKGEIDKQASDSPSLTQTESDVTLISENESLTRKEIPIAASDVFIGNLTNLVQDEDILSIIGDQRHMMSRFEKTNEMLLTINSLSAQRYDAMYSQFKKSTQMMFDMKKDLDSVFKRIRNLKTKLSKKYPQAFEACSDVYNVLQEESEELESVQESTRKS